MPWTLRTVDEIPGPQSVRIIDPEGKDRSSEFVSATWECNARRLPRLTLVTLCARIDATVPAKDVQVL
jgi:hypothetical protein